MTQLNAAYAGWDTDSHAQTFDFWNRKSGIEFDFYYGAFSENQYLISAVRELNNPYICDVGCATGTSLRYLRSRIGRAGFNYMGVDVSAAAIQRTKELYPNEDFRQVLPGPIKEQLGRSYDIVFSRDTVLHQTDPYGFLGELLELTQKTLILRLRTRDHGESVLDHSKSCQMHYDKHWMPYLVLNTNELLDWFIASGRVSRIVINRSYEVLGGMNYRFLPKELYQTSAGGAETSLRIDLSSEASELRPEIIEDKTLQGHKLLMESRFKRLGYAMWSRLAGRK